MIPTARIRDVWYIEISYAEMQCELFKSLKSHYFLKFFTSQPENYRFPKSTLAKHVELYLEPVHGQQ